MSVSKQHSNFRISLSWFSYNTHNDSSWPVSN